MRRLLLALGILLACSVSAQAAITVDNHKDCSAATTTNTCSYTITSATILVCGTSVGSTTGVTSITWNGTSMGADVAHLTNGPSKVQLFALVSPATGTHNVVATEGSTGDFVNLACVSYDGTSITSQPEATNTASNTASTSISGSVTTITANAWVVTYGTVHAGAGTPTATGSITHTYSTAATFNFLGDTGAIASPGATTTGFNETGAGNMEWITASIAPAGGGGGPAGCKNGLLMNGVGCLAR